MDINKEIPIKVDEDERIYYYPGGEFFVIKDVIELIVRESGTHRLKDKHGNLWIVLPEWRVVKVKTTTGEWTV